MPRIPTLIHGVADYAVGLLLIVSPWLFGFSQASRAAVYTPIVFGVAAFIYSVLTRYELGVIPIIPMRMHLAMDVFSGVLLAVSPFALGYHTEVKWPMVIIGLFEIAAGLMTRPIPTVTSAPDYGSGPTTAAR